MSPAADYFARRHEEQKKVVETDRECAECGYNLRGLREGGRCPECGSAIERPLASDDPLSRMPWRVIRVFLGGAWIAIGAIVLAVAGVWLRYFDIISPMILASCVPVIAGAWVAAMLMLTPAFSFPEAVVRGFTRRSALRRAARWGQLAWIVAGVAYALAEIAPLNQNSATILHTLVGLSVIVGWIATMLLAFLLERLAEWVRDDTAETVFNWFLWATPLSAIALWMSGSVGVVRIVIMGVVMAAIALFPIAVLSLAKSITFSWQHHIESAAREDRRTERARRDAAKLAARIDRVGRG